MTIVEHIGTVYGPVPSWRLGSSLGIDLTSNEGKICSFDCTYCQLGKTTNLTIKRGEFVSTERVLSELKDSLTRIKADVITFSGTGEPTLASNLGEVADEIKMITDLPLAILTNSSLMSRKDVMNDLKKIDVVIAKLDAPNEELFQEINRSASGITFESLVSGIKQFREEYNGKFALQIMFVDANKDHASELAELAREINPDEVQLDVAFRQSPERQLTMEEVTEIKKAFKGINTVSYYDKEKPIISRTVGDVRKRRPKTK